ncbi:MAG: DUF2238 domain-containing protein [Gammaproteobacteria bacterium]|nr:DUF2238 domain-containing protein [Gammaproteobacteria bacterium]
MYKKALLMFFFISSISVWYEILEWIGMVLFCSEPDCLQLVTQGDEWDTQKDMAFAGAVIALLIHTKNDLDHLKRLCH